MSVHEHIIAQLRDAKTELDAGYFLQKGAKHNLWPSADELKFALVDSGEHDTADWHDLFYAVTGLISGGKFVAEDPQVAAMAQKNGPSIGKTWQEQREHEFPQRLELLIDYLERHASAGPASVGQAMIVCICGEKLKVAKNAENSKKDLDDGRVRRVMTCSNQGCGVRGKQMHLILPAGIAIDRRMPPKS